MGYILAAHWRWYAPGVILGLWRVWWPWWQVMNFHFLRTGSRNNSRPVFLVWLESWQKRMEKIFERLLYQKSGAAGERLQPQRWWNSDCLPPEIRYRLPGGEFSRSWWMLCESGWGAGGHFFTAQDFWQIDRRGWKTWGIEFLDFYRSHKALTWPATSSQGVFIGTFRPFQRGNAPNKIMDWQGRKFLQIRFQALNMMAGAAGIKIRNLALVRV